MSTPAADLHPCECGCGEMVKNRFARGHHLRKTRRLVPLPGPDVPDDELDMGLLEPDFPDQEGWRGAGSPEDHAIPPRDVKLGPMDPGDISEPDEPLEPDRPPGHLSGPPRGREAGPRSRPVRVTAAVRKDIAAKIKMPLFLTGKIWEARDPWCGGVFVVQTDPITDALTDIVCDSADLVAFFTGPAGGFMKYLNLCAALAPVVQMGYAHHVAHSVGREGNGQVQGQPDMRAYAA